MLRQQSPALHVRPVSEYPTRMTSKQGACNFSTKVGNGPNNSYSFLPLTFISGPDLLNCAQPHYINGCTALFNLGPGRLDITCLTPRLPSQRILGGGG